MSEPICMDCDGCGWTEGGPTLKTTCQTCNGTGQETPRRQKIFCDCGQAKYFCTKSCPMPSEGQ